MKYNLKMLFSLAIGGCERQKLKKKMRCFTFHINNKVPYGKLILLV